MTEQQPKLPWWVAARSLRSALTVAIGYSVLFVLFVVIAVGGGSFWNVLLGILAALLAALEWMTVAYFRKRRS
jgi:hypothetical protein